MRDQLEMDEVEEQLRLYGRWLNARSEVGLSAGGIAPAATAVNREDGEDGHGHAGGPRPGSRRFLALTATLVAVVAGGGLLLTVGGDGDGGVTTAAEQSTTSSTTADGDRADTGAADRTPDADQPDRSDGATVDADADEAEMEESEPEEPEDVGTDESTDNTVATTVPDSDTTPESTTTSQDDGDTGDGDGDDGGSDTSAPSGIGGDMMFLSPAAGSTVDMNLGAEFQVAEVAGAVSYEFSGTQAGAVVMQLTVSNPRFLMPSQLIAGGQLGWTYEPGVMTVNVVALDDAGNELGTGSIQIVLKSGGGAPRFGPSIPSGPGTTTP